MDDRQRLQREVLAGLDNLQRMVSQERNREDGVAAERGRINDLDREEVARLRAQMDELHRRFTHLCARIDTQTTEDGSADVRSKAAHEPEFPPVPQVRPPAFDPLRQGSRLAQGPPNRARVRRLAVLGTIAVIACMLAWFRFKYPGSGQVAIQTQPSQADVYIDGQFRGQTPLRIKSVQAGSHAIRIDKEGFQSFTGDVRVDNGETAQVDARLNEMSAAELQVLARSLFDQGKLREADRICTLLFQKPPHDSFALELKEKILTGLLARISPEGQASDSSSAGAASRGTVSTSETELSRAVPPTPTPAKTGPVPATRISQAKQQTSVNSPRGSSQKPFQKPGLEPTVRAARPTESTPQAKPQNDSPQQSAQIEAEKLALIKNAIQARNLAEARSLLGQLPETSEPAGELRNLLQLAETDIQKQRSLVSAALQKAESALIVGHYISPPEDNVVFHCNRGLGFDPQNSRLLALKKDVINRSIDQARDWIRRGKFEQASASYSVLNRLAQSDNGFPVRREWFQEELKNLEFTSYPVIHPHKFGSCQGRLRMNAHALSFVPSDDSLDGFTESLRNVVVTQGGETLKIRVGGKSYHFQPNSGSNRYGFQGVYEQLMSLVAKAAN